MACPPRHPGCTTGWPVRRVPPASKPRRGGLAVAFGVTGSRVQESLVFPAVAMGLQGHRASAGAGRRPDPTKATRNGDARAVPQNPLPQNSGLESPGSWYPLQRWRFPFDYAPGAMRRGQMQRAQMRGARTWGVWRVFIAAVFSLPGCARSSGDSARPFGSSERPDFYSVSNLPLHVVLAEEGREGGSEAPGPRASSPGPSSPGPSKPGPSKPGPPGPGPPGGVANGDRADSGRAARPGRAGGGRTGGAARGPEDKSRRDFGGNCLAGGCHAQLSRTPWVHAPVSVGACATCHVAEGDPVAHDFRSPRPQEQLCSFCHAPATAKPHRHRAYADADCGACHDPHGGQTAAMLLSSDVSRLCGRCHDGSKPHAQGEEPSAFSFLHTPVAKGRCLDCHRAHQSEHPQLLTRPARELCLGCHPQVRDLLAKAAHVHKPLEANCSSCHSAHGADDRRLLRKSPTELCLGCHIKTANSLMTPHHLHGAMGSCLACHLAHAGENEKLVLTPLSAACFRCHSEEMPLPTGKTIRNVFAEVSAARFKHGPVNVGDCGACHDSHTSANEQLLSHRYDRQFYSAFSESSFALCFSCHDKRLATEEQTVLTGFRDGSRNLHFLHVNRKKGRTCGVCHEAHGGSREALLRTGVSFGPGGWTLPIDFKRTATGGTCTSGCHQDVTYVNASPTAPAATPSSHPQPKGATAQ